jgi:hypothetical protein
MVRRLTIIAAFLFFLVPAISFAQSNNNCIPWVCEYPPDGCSYCQVINVNGNSNCVTDGMYDGGCDSWGFCNTGLGGCSDEFSCMLGADNPGFWIRLSPPRSFRDEWQLVDVSVKRKAVHHLRRS